MATLEQIKITAADLQAAGQATQEKNVDPTVLVEVTRGENGMTIVMWHTNGTTGVMIHDGKIVSIE
jgi:hypothetical protein